LERVDKNVLNRVSIGESFGALGVGIDVDIKLDVAPRRSAARPTWGV
jgi:hypothetical protein